MARRTLAFYFLTLVLSFPVRAADDGWQGTSVPKVWKQPPKDLFTKGGGYVWFRCFVDIPANWSDRTFEIFSEPADDARGIYINGVHVADSGAFPPNYQSGLGGKDRFTIPKDAIRFGQPNVVAVRVYDFGGRNRFNVAAPALFAGTDAVRLLGDWQFRQGDPKPSRDAIEITEELKAYRFTKVESADEISRTLRKLEDDAGPLAPADALPTMKTHDDLVVDLVLSDPVIGQPLSMKWDGRGRLWLVEYLQYPVPAGLKAISRDIFLRTVYDQMPLPPPRHFKGQDRISIHEDRDGDGVYEARSVFVDGLSLCSSFAIGRGGVYVLNPPYFLFYPDKDHNDQPDGAPEVLLEGFGIEDSHSIANSLRWGPDGWLYACQGSTVSGKIKRYGGDDKPVMSMGQLLWRYHPETRKFEIFAEGGGNTFGLEFDAKGRAYSGHNGGDTRGFHYVQGGYYRKGFDKHGELSNPFAFGYFNNMTHAKVPRFSHTFIIYEGGGLTPAHRGNLFGVVPLLSHVVESTVRPEGSSFKTEDIGLALQSKDTWFRPVDVQAGPDGGVYVADMYEQRIDHASHYQGRVSKETGRIYRLRAKDAPKSVKVDLVALPSAELVKQLDSPNKWTRQTTQDLLRDRKDASVAPLLVDRLFNQSGQSALESLWALHAVGGLTEHHALQALGHADPYVRLWTARILADEGQLSLKATSSLVSLARDESHVEVRSQLACSARRLPTEQALPILRALAGHSEDVADIHLPLLIWWGIEAHAEKGRDAVVKLFEDPAFWTEPMVEGHLIERIMRRYAQAGRRQDLLTCARLLALAPSPAAKKKLLAGFEAAFEGRPLGTLPQELIAELAKTEGGSLSLRLRQGLPEAIAEAFELIENEKTKAKERIELVEVLGQTRPQAAPSVLVRLIGRSKVDDVRKSAILALTGFNDPAIGTQLLDLQASLSEDLQAASQTVLTSRPTWAKQLLDRIAAGQMKKESVPTATVRKLLLLPDPKLAEAVGQIWGALPGATTEQMRKQVDKLSDLLSSGAGNPAAGKKTFMESCGKCHRLFNQGGRIGPDLTTFKRDDLKRMLLHVVNPSAEIREGYENFVILTDDGQTLNGFIADQDNQVVVLRGVDGQTTVIPKPTIESMKAVPTSLMPEGMLDKMSTQQIRDLFAFLRATQPVP